MAALRRRTTFAAPFVITVVAACPSKDVRPPEAQSQSWTVKMRDMKCEAQQDFRPPANYKGPPPNPPPPQAVECPPGMASAVVMTIEQAPGKSYCTSRTVVTPCPLPYGQEVKRPLQIIWQIEKEGADCHAEELSSCPKGTDCNPPSPVHFPCPPGVTEDHPLVLAELPDATCVRVPNDCLDTGCAREKVPCLPPDAKPIPRD